MTPPRTDAHARMDVLDVRALDRYAWLVERDLDCIISPDSDGILCGLFMSHYLGWRIRGFYDGKALVCDAAIQPRDCVFLDMEIFDPRVRSVGQHMLLYNHRQVPSNWDRFAQCYAINNYRSFTGARHFKWKYPFGTIHFLIATLAQHLQVALPETACAPLLFTDGTYHNLFRYTENSLDWLRYLRITEEASPLYNIFCRDQRTIRELMLEMDAFWAERDRFSIPGQRGDRIAITARSRAGGFNNLVAQGDLYAFANEPKDRAESFVRLLAERTGWGYAPDRWSWRAWNKIDFKKDTLSPITNSSFSAMVARVPLSFVMRSGTAFEYTLGTLE